MRDEMKLLTDVTIKEKLELLLDIGEVMMESGGDSRRIVRDMLRTGAYLGLHWKHINVHITYTTIMVNYDDESQSCTIFRKCRNHGVNLSAIAAVRRVIWRAIEQQYTIGVFKKELDAILLRCRGRYYSPIATAIAAGIACGGFCKLFGCDWVAFVYTAIAACIGFLSRRWCNSFEINSYVSTAVAACVATMVAYGTSYLPGSDTPWLPMVACMLFLVPGIPLMNSFDDLMNNYVVSGMTRAFHTMLVVFAMTFGIVGAISVCEVPQYASYSIVPSGLDGSQIAAAAIATIGFSVIFNVRPQLLPVVAIGGIIAVSTRNVFSIGLGVSQVWASFIGAAVMGVIGFVISRRLRVPRSIVTIPCVIPMIPGVLMYRLLIGIFTISELSPAEFLVVMQVGVTSFLIICAIAIGATLPDILTHQFIERTKHKQLHKLLVASRGMKGGTLKTASDIDQGSKLK